jgi:hippurate hydrolase
MKPFLPLAQQMSQELHSTMCRLHRHPELSFQEVETTKLIKEKLTALGLEIVDLGMPTGTVAVLRSDNRPKNPDMVVAIRADIDAIVETELANGPVSSEVTGVMHGCGHDLHTTCALGAAALLSSVKSSLAGDVVFVFQPAEEVTQGAAEMLRHGLMEKLPARPRSMFGLHSWPIQTGLVGVRHDTVAAGKTNFRITLKGRGGQGGFPHECVDVVVAGTALIEAIQTIVSRNADPRKSLVCAVYSVHAGAQEFFVTDTMTLSGSVRALDTETLGMAEQRLEQLTNSIAGAYACAGNLALMPQTPPLANAPELFELARTAAQRVVGAENVVEPPPMLGSDDFAVFGEVMPVFYFQLGVMDPSGESSPLHSPYFCVDHRAIPLGSALLAESTCAALESWAAE